MCIEFRIDPAGRLIDDDGTPVRSAPFDTIDDAERYAFEVGGYVGDFPTNGISIRTVLR
jgi:hypothetical protein